MDNKSKHPSDIKGKGVLSLSAVLILLCSITGCSSDETSARTSGAQSIVQSGAPSGTESVNGQTGFDIETVRKSLIVKGVPFEVPTRVGDLGKEWTYEKYDSHYVDGTGLADFYYNGQEMFVAGIGNFTNGDEKDGFIYDVALETEDCSIGGITPGVSTKDDVLKKYGKPAKTNSYEATSEKKARYRYIYGIQDSVQEFAKIEHSQMFTVIFYADTDIVQGVRVVYNTLEE